MLDLEEYYFIGELIAGELGVHVQFCIMMHLILMPLTKLMK